MTGTIKRVTSNYNLRIPIFDAPGWGREVERNFDIIDAVMFLLSNFGSVKGLWLNGTAYVSGERVIDPSDGKLYQAQVDHTSAASGTFAQERATHPTYWKLISSTTQNRGEWVTGTTYNTNDFIVHDHKYGVAVTGFTSGVSYDADVLAGNIITLIDLTDDYNDVTNAASYISTMETAINTLYNIHTDITTVGAIDTDVASVAAIATDVTTVANNTGDVSTVATNIADVQSAATNMSDIQAAPAAASMAQKWATEAEDVPVTSGLYSAFHWAMKAAATFTNGIAGSIHAALGKTTPTNNDELALVDSADGWSLKRLTWANLRATLAQSSAVDTTAGKLMAVGAFGLGAQLVSAETNINNYRTSGMYITPSSGLTNLPAGWPHDRYIVIVGGGTGYNSQIIMTTTAGAALAAYRSYTGSVWTAWQVIATEALALLKSGGDMTGRLTTAASAGVAGAGLRIPHGVAPNTPVNGDVWTDTTGVHAHINGTTRRVWDDAIPLAEVETGVWTPSIVYASQTAAPTYTSRSGVYYKIGKMVFASFGMVFSNRGAGGSTSLAGLPFVSAARFQYSANLWYSAWTSVSGFPIMEVQQSATTARIYLPDTTSVASVTPTTHLTNVSQFYGTCIYEAAT